VPGGELTSFQKDILALVQQDVRELHLVINKHKPYGKSHAHLNSLSKASSQLATVPPCMVATTPRRCWTGASAATRATTAW